MQNKIKIMSVCVVSFLFCDEIQNFCCLVPSSAAKCPVSLQAQMLNFLKPKS